MLGKLNQTKLMNDLFRREHDVYWDLTTGLVGIRTKDGIFTGVVDTDGEEAVISIQQNVFEDFGMQLPAYSMKVQLKDVKVGDIVAGESVLGFVEKVNENSLNLRKLNGQLTTGYRPPKVNVTIASGNVRVIRPLFAFGQKDDQPNAGFLGSLQSNPMLLMMMMKGDANESSFDKIMPLLLLGGLNGSESPFGQGGNMMQTMLMMQMFSGKNDISKAFDL